MFLIIIGDESINAMENCSRQATKLKHTAQSRRNVIQAKT